MHHGQNNMTLFIILAYPVGNSPTMLISYLSCNLANVDISVAIITYKTLDYLTGPMYSNPSYVRM